MNLQPHTLAMLRCELLSLRHPDNPEPRLTRATLLGMCLALISTEAITYNEMQAINELAANAAGHQLHKTPWPAKQWLPF